MKTRFRHLTSAIAVLAATCMSLAPLDAAEKDKEHDHDHAHMTGPNGGKVLHDLDPHAELLVTKDRKLQITFLTEEGKAAAAGKQSVSCICGKRSKPTRMKFALKGKSFLSDKTLPEGKHIPTVLQIRMDPKEKPSIIRINLDLSQCPTCHHLEYACTCDHHHEDDKKKDK